jgi:hypothetical protein
MPVRRFSWTVLGFISLLTAVGCGGPTVKVKGRVTLDGQPVPGATIQFVSIGPECHPAVGHTDGEGNFDLSSYKEHDGAWRGEYKVLVAKKEVIKDAPPPQPTNPDAPPTPQSKMPAQAMAKSFGGSKYGKPRRDLLPPIYGDPSATPLRMIVPTDGDVELDLRSDIKR